MMKSKPIRLTLFLSLLLLLSACGLINEQLTPTAATAIAPTPTVEIILEVATETAVSVPEEIEVDVAESRQQLIIWLPASFADVVDIDGETAVFQEQLQIFAKNNPTIDIIIEEKEVEGSGGMLDYLRTGRPIAPTILPHLLILPVDRLPVATQAGLLQPIDAYVSNDMMANLYPAATEMVDVNGEMMGYPIFVTNLSHMIYDETLFTQGLEPRRWLALTAVEEARFAFPAAGTDGTIFLLQRYLDEGGRVADDDGTPILDLEPLTNALITFADATTGGTIIPASATMTSFNDIWPYLEEENGANIAQVSVAQFLEHQTSLEGIAFIALPGTQKPLTPLLNGWAWAIPQSPDEAANGVAAELLAFLSGSKRLASWSEDNNLLPANRDALAGWSTADSPYMQFISAELERADELPIADHSAIMIALSGAIIDVVSLNKTAIEAAQTAVSAISP